MGCEPLVKIDLAEAWIIVRNQRRLFELGSGIGDLRRGFDNPRIAHCSQILRNQVADGEPFGAGDLEYSVARCGQCHLRGGKSRSTGLPYSNNFVAGDNLFRDFEIDLSEAALQRLNPADRHVQENVRDVALLGKSDVNCLSCHDVHKQSARKHHTVAAGNICLSCHAATGPKKTRAAYEVHSTTCGY